MNEYYLHFIWKLKRLPFHQMKLVDEKDFRLIDSGSHNEFENGPDFQNGAIELENLKWFGAIEIHVNSSDWYAHKHHFDKRYDAVILHVVYNHDKVIIQNGRILPTLELKNWIDKAHFKKYQTLRKISSISCKNQFDSIPSIYFENMKTRAMISRLERKTKSITELTNSESDSLLLFIAHSFGANVNQEPFIQLAQRIPSDLKLKLTKEEFVNYVLELSFSNSSLLSSQWSTKGNRFVSSASKRVREFAEFVYEFNFHLEFWDNETHEIVTFFRNIFLELGWKKEKMLLKNIFINAIVPFLFTLGRFRNNSNLEDKALNLLMMIDTEEHGITRKWKEVGVSCKNAFDSQAVLEIYQQFCTKKQCLNCTVGIKLLNQ